MPPGLDVNFEASFGQRRENCGYNCNPPIARITFFRNTDDHEHLPV